jgi:AraC-like DNA-binding protein
LAKVAVAGGRSTAVRAGDLPGGITTREVGAGAGWTAEDVVCTAGPHDRPFEERHERVSVAIVLAGTFQYRATRTAELMTPGSLLLGDVGQSFECSHDHATGDRCLSFHYAPELFERLAREASGRRSFGIPRLPPLRPLSDVVARAWAALRGSLDVSWEELGLQLAARAAQLAAGVPPDPTDPAPSAVARVTRAVRAIERQPDAPLTVAQLAREARLSPYHFLRTFHRLTGLTPHQYVRRVRLREAAARLALGSAPVLDVALDSGFGDVSNFNRAFRVEFGVSPRVYRRYARAR